VVLDFLSTTDVGRLVPAPAKEDAQSEASEWERRGAKRSGGRRLRSWARAERSNRSSSSHPLHGLCGRGVGVTGANFVAFHFSFFCHLFCYFPWSAFIIFLGQPWAEDKGELATRRLRTADGNWIKKWAAVVYIG
jgi:hypothetical protein